jgi:hypothetical protein
MTTVGDFTLDEEQWLTWEANAPAADLDRLEVLFDERTDELDGTWLDRRWPVLLAVGMFVVYVIAGLWVLHGAGYAIGDTIARASAARAIAHSRDQHLMAVGFYWMPWTTFAEVPFMAVFSRLGIQEWAIVFPTAIAGASTIPVLACIGRDLDVPRRWTVALVLVFAINPYTIFYAGNGMSEIWTGLFLAGAAGSYLRWLRLHRTRDLATLAAWLGMVQFTRYEALLFVLIFTAAVAWQSPKGRRAASGFAVALPGLFVLVAWTITAIIIVKQPWWGVQGETATDTAIVVLDGAQTFANSFEYSVRMSLRISPLILVVALLVGLHKDLLGQIRRRDRSPLWALPIVLVAGFFPAQVTYFLMNYLSFGDARYFTPLIVMTAVLSLVAMRGSTSSAKGWILVLAAASSWVGSLATFNDRTVSPTGEEAVIRRLLGQQPRTTFFVDVDSWQRYAAAVDAQIGRDDVLVIDSRVAHPYQLFTSKPKQVASDRDKESERLLARARTPYTMALVPTQRQGDKDVPVIGSPQSTAIVELVQRNPTGKRWEQVDGLPPVAGIGVGGYQLWKLVDTGDRPDSPDDVAPTAPAPTRPSAAGPVVSIGNATTGDKAPSSTAVASIPSSTKAPTNPSTAPGPTPASDREEDD